MPEAIAFLDCCGEPLLETVKVLRSTECEIVSIRCCQNCQGHWYYRMLEYTLSTDAYNRRTWYVKLAPEEVAVLEKARELSDVTCFACRPGFLKDEDGVSKIQGIPYFLQ